jgi:hypothetical protein
MCSHDVARHFVQRQFESKTVDTNADIDTHFAEFEDLWDWSLSEWDKALSPSEGHKFELLRTSIERDAFRIIRDFHRSASHSRHSEFPISRDSLAERLQISGEGAGKLRRKFCALGIIRLIKAHVAHRQCAYYQWCA